MERQLDYSIENQITTQTRIYSQSLFEFQCSWVVGSIYGFDITSFFPYQYAQKFSCSENHLKSTEKERKMPKIFPFIAKRIAVFFKKNMWEVMHRVVDKTRFKMRNIYEMSKSTELKSGKTNFWAEVENCKKVEEGRKAYIWIIETHNDITTILKIM